ncbi:beta-galactosidase [Hahella sp. NBU794]|uniref:beta-galactosidase n=1 Tax=Hahella sp. NBU794 TaxID=3422590 RepID=UPI003D6F50A3
MEQIGKLIILLSALAGLIPFSAWAEDAGVASQTPSTSVKTAAPDKEKIAPPRGIFSSHVIGKEADSLRPAFVKGGLVRVFWSDIEPKPGQYDFSVIEAQLQGVRHYGKLWSLAVLAGPRAPDWLFDEGAGSMEIRFRGERTRIVPYWDLLLQARLKLLAEALGKKYGNDETLKLVYVPQATSNGIEGHFNGNRYEDLQRQGFTPDKWVRAAGEAIDSFYRAFPQKYLAFEVHEIGTVETPERIMRLIEKNYRDRVGIAVWWLSGRENYQNALLQEVRDFRGYKYAQAIGRSDQGRRFGAGGYGGMFEQAKKLGIRYIEVWNYEITRNRNPEVTQSIEGFSRSEAVQGEPGA